jgi:hypothetical protein
MVYMRETRETVVVLKNVTKQRVITIFPLVLVLIGLSRHQLHAYLIIIDLIVVRLKIDNNESS